MPYDRRVFATLSAGYPGPDGLAAQSAAGLEPLSDGADWGARAGVAAELLRGGRSADLVASWRALADAPEAAGRAVRAEVAGPYTFARRSDAPADERRRLTLSLAEALNDALRSLAGAGCPLVQVDEPDAVRIGDDETERRLFGEAHRRLLEGVTGTHPSLCVIGGSADAAGPATFFDLPYRSYLFDLIEGPDNWRLIALAPADRGVICGAMDARTARLDEREILVWAAHYAASTAGRGPERVGLAPSGSLAHLSAEQARRKIDRLADAARLAGLPGRELAETLDPRAVRSRSRALRGKPRR